MPPIDTPHGNPRVSLTGYATASAWAHYGFEYAHWFDTRRGRALFAPLHLGCRAIAPLAPAAGAFTETLYWRHRWFSAWTAAQTPALAIEIGAGLSTRGIAYAARHPDSRWIDYDLPDMVAARRTRLAGRDLPNNYALRGGDLLSDGLGAELVAPTAGPTVALTEGVTDYLDKTEKRRAFSTVAAMLDRLGGGHYLFEAHPRERLARFGPAATLLLNALRRISGRDLADQLFADTDEALAMLRDCGFAKARVLPENELEDAGQAPPPGRRAFVLIEAER